ncbi:MAG: amidophosphoribosyltransferase, partial [Nitrospira sp.]|nr:amidophosphoribosyltransferase [Nitrospira sp.]
QIIQMAREAGARKVYFASASPPVRYPNVYGIDMPAAHELIAHGRSDDEVEKELGADWLIYQDLPDLIQAVQKGNPALTRFDTSCFNGEYVTGDIDQDYLDRLSHRRNDQAKSGRSHDNGVMGLHNAG